MKIISSEYKGKTSQPVWRPNLKFQHVRYKLAFFHGSKSYHPYSYFSFGFVPNLLGLIPNFLGYVFIVPFFFFLLS